MTRTDRYVLREALVPLILSLLIATVMIILLQLQQELGGAGRSGMSPDLLGMRVLRALPQVTWCLKGIFPATGLAAIFGPSSSGKSFLALDLAAAIAEGAPWFGFRTTKTPTVYMALEGEGVFSQRVAA